MKKMFLFAAMASVALASCTTDESVFEGAKANGEKIEFVAANYAAQTRGGHGEEDAFSNENFAVYAWEKGTNYAHMTNVVMVEDGTSWKEQNNIDYYWPNNTNLDFTAVSPANDPAINATLGREDDGSETTITFTFTSTKPNTTTTNLMYADYVTEKYDYDVDAAAPVVPLLFRHVLAKLKVVVHQNDNPSTMPTGIDDYNVRVRKLYITGIKNQGTFTVNNAYVAEAKAGDADDIWTGQAGSATWNILGSAAVNDTVDDVTSVEGVDYVSTKDFANYYVMPQNVEDDTQLTIEYVLTTEFTSGVTAEKVYTKTIKLNTIKNGSTAIANWYTNKYITYTINITPAALEPITFSVQEENWCEEVNGSTTLQGEDEI